MGSVIVDRGPEGMACKGSSRAPSRPGEPREPPPPAFPRHLICWVCAPPESLYPPERRVCYR